MKYNENNKPLVCMMTQSTCYKGTRKFEPKGILWHSTGANNPNLKRYVQPDDNAADREKLISLLGKNQYKNDWNHAERQAGLNFWIGKLADGSVAAVQTMPWDYRPWGCGSGTKGSCNNTHIQFEICEDGLDDASYFNAAYKEACEMTAYLCQMYGIDPNGTTVCNGVTVPTIIDHAGSHSLGLGSNHADIQHWSKRYGKTMENVRNDVAAILAEATKQVSVDTSSDGRSDEQVIWDTLYAAIGNTYGTAGLMGNLYAESGLRSDNLQNTYEKSLGMTDAQYTASVDNGSYENFVNDHAGYGLAQWTYWSRKEALLNYAKEAGKSVGDLQTQLAFLIQEIKGYKTVWDALTSATSVREASDAVLTRYENPADQSDTVKERRAGFGQTFYDKYAVFQPAIAMLSNEKAESDTSQNDTSLVSQPAIAMYSKTQLDEKYAKYINSTGTHYISNNGHDENSAYKGGQAGDQTGTEWQLRKWYNRPWSCVLRYPDQKVGLKLAQLGIDAALNDKIGYDQGQRSTYWKQLQAVGYDPSKITVACESDCSAGVCANVKAAGYLLGIKALQTHGGTYTGDMRSALKKAGFQVLTDSKYLASGDYLLPGDILLNDGAHTATNVTLGAKVQNEWNATATSAEGVGSTTTTYYRVRRSWSEKASQIGAFTVLANAKLCVDQNPGYAAFDDAGNQVYPAVTSFPRYALTDSQLKQIARLCQQEQGTVAGAKAEASLMANQLETDASRRQKYGTGADGLYNWVRNGGWFSRAAHWMDEGSVSDAILAGVKDVLVNGNRTLPLYVDEHDCLSDIESISTGSVKDRNAYVQGKTIVKNRYSSTWTFWCFPDSTSDPFGYTEKAYKAATAGQPSDVPYKVRVSISTLNYRKGPSKSYDSYGYIEPGVYTIVEEQDGWGLLKAYADERNGWIMLSYVTRI